MSIYRGKGNAEQYDAFMDFINYVFGFNGNQKDFKKLLPKLYRRELQPQMQNYIVTEDGNFRAAVGAYDHEIVVCGRRLPCRGIGNVAVHPYHRGQGYMKDCMNAALADMKRDGIVLSTLGGRRQRYNYFSYDKTGSMYQIHLVDDNMRHSFGATRTPAFAMREVFAGDVRALDDIAALLAAQIYVPVRAREELYPIMTTWHTRIFAAYSGEHFIGYATCLDTTVREVMTVEDADFLPLICTLYDYLHAGTLIVCLPEFRQTYLRAIYRIGEGVSVTPNMSYTVLNYRAVLDAFFALKATYTALPDGDLPVLIHGFAGDEQLLLSVRDGVPCISETRLSPVLELSHPEALQLLFGPFCPDRLQLPAFARCWLPLPVWMYHVDEV